MMVKPRKDGRYSASKVVEGRRIWGYGQSEEAAKADLQQKLSTRSTGTF